MHPGDTAVISGFKSEIKSKARLVEMGLLPGTEFRIIKQAPFNGVHIGAMPAQVALDASLGRASFHYGPQQLEYRHGPIIPKAFTWPASLDDSRISLTLEDLGGRRMTLHGQQGTWSLFRLLEQNASVGKT